MTNSVPVANLVGPYPDDVLAAIIREVDASNPGPAGLTEAILRHPAWPALAEQFHPQEPTQPVPTPTNAPEPIAEVLPASGEDWAAVVRKAAQPDGHEARVMLEIQQRLVTVEGPVSKAEPEPAPRLVKLGLTRNLQKALGYVEIEGAPLCESDRYALAYHLVFNTEFGPLLLKAPKQPASPWGAWRPMDEAPTDGTRILAHDRSYYVNIAYWSRRNQSWQNSMGKLSRHWLCAWMPLPEAPKKP